MRSEGRRVSGDLLPSVDHLIQIDVDAHLRHRVGWGAVNDVELTQTHMLRPEVLIDTDQFFIGFDGYGEKRHCVVWK